LTRITKWRGEITECSVIRRGKNSLGVHTKRSADAGDGKNFKGTQENTRKNQDGEIGVRKDVSWEAPKLLAQCQMNYKWGMSRAGEKIFLKAKGKRKSGRN